MLFSIASYHVSTNAGTDLKLPKMSRAFRINTCKHTHTQHTFESGGRPELALMKNGAAGSGFIRCRYVWNVHCTITQQYNKQ